MLLKNRGATSPAESEIKMKDKEEGMYKILQYSPCMLVVLQIWISEII